MTDVQCEHCAKLEKISFLQNHYNRYRDAGGNHAAYIIVNDLSGKTAKELRKSYEATHSSASEEKQCENCHNCQCSQR